MREYLHSFTKLELGKVKQHILGYTLSDLGREHVEKLAPSSDLLEIQSNLRAVSEMKRILESDDYPPLEHISDIRTSLRRASIEDYILPSQELHKIALLLSTAEKVRSYFSRRQALYPTLWGIVIPVQINKLLEYNIRKAIDDEGNVRDNASKALSIVRKQILEQKEALKRSLESILKSVAGKDWIQEEIITTRDGRMVIPVKVEHKNRVPGFIHSASSSGATVFVEPTVTLELNNDIRSLEFEERREIDRILKELTEQVRESREVLEQTTQGLGMLDFIHAKAKYSIEVMGVEPGIGEDLRLSEAYHPVLLLRHKREEVVPLTLELGRDASTLIITGPNSGGKTVALKTIGLLNLLLQSGCHIPAGPETQMKLFADVFVEIGDQQSIEDDLSSFGSHLASLREILKQAGPSSLVLIDEICSNTDPSEGASLAAAVIEELTRRGCLSVITTHHGSLKAIAAENGRIENGAMEFDQKSLRPNYRFVPGIPGSSYAIEMAERMDLGSDIIERSKQLKGNEANRLEQLITSLESKAQDLKANLDSAQTEKGRLEGMITQYDKKMRALDSDLKGIKARAVEEAGKLIEKSGSTIERLVREIRERAAEPVVIAAAKKEIQSLRDELAKITKEVENEQPITYDFKKGATVRLKDSDTVGEIASGGEHGTYVVLVGGIKVRVPKEGLEPAAPRGDRGSVSHELVNSIQVKNEIDLRGMYGDEAVEAVERFISDAVVSGLHRVEIIHGKGTGALRKRITAYLKGNPAIKSFRLGEWNEGGSGVTVVELE